MTNQNDESTGSLRDEEYEAWADRLSRMGDEEASYEIYQRVRLSNDLNEESKRLLDDGYEYCRTLIKQGKALEFDLFKIHLEKIKGYDLSTVNLYTLVALLGCCGIIFKK